MATDYTSPAVVAAAARYKTFRNIAIAFAVVGVVATVLLIPAGAWFFGILLIIVGAIIWYSAGKQLMKAAQSSQTPAS